MNKTIRFIIFLLCLHYVTNKEEKNFGKFDLRLDRFEACNGPKSKDCCDIAIDTYNSTAVKYDLNVKKPSKITKGKIVATTGNSNFLRLQMKNPCDHLFMQELFQTKINVSKKCVVPPGHYQLEFDVDKIAKSYYGGNFIYGTFTFRAQFLTDDCNFSCTELDVTFVPQKPTH